MEQEFINFNKVGIIGCGFVGAASAFSLMQSGLFTEMVLIDSDKARAEGEALDISHGVPFAKPMKIYAGDYDNIKDAGLLIITAGANQKPGETRLDLVKKNISIFKSIIPEITKRNLVLDTARLKYNLGQHLDVDSRSVHAFIIGEHGDSEIAAWSCANVSGIKLDKFCEMRGHFNHQEATKRIAEEVKNSAYEIISRKKATYYGIAMSVKRICEAIVRNEKSILPISSLMNGEYGISGVALSMPAIVNRQGVETHVPLQLNEEEVAALKKSADTLKKILEENEI